MIIQTEIVGDSGERINITATVVKNRTYPGYAYGLIEGQDDLGRPVYLTPSLEDLALRCLERAAAREVFCSNCLEHSQADCAEFGCPAPPSTPVEDE